MTNQQAFNVGRLAAPALEWEDGVPVSEEARQVSAARAALHNTGYSLSHNTYTGYKQHVELFMFAETEREMMRNGLQ